ncbi:MAG: hypothetical protein ACJ8LG_17705 [Massilia sp.]
MDWLNQNRQKSQLGQILVGKKLISEDQLEQAIAEQGRTGQRLGEVLAAMKLITDAQVRGAIRRQRNLRMAAAVATALLGPLQAYAAVAAAPAAVVGARTLGAERGMRELSDEELGEVAAQGRNDDALREQALLAALRLAALAAQGGQGAAADALAHAKTGDGAQVLGELARVFNPLSMLFGAETSIRGVVYDPANSTAVINKDGSVTLRLPSTIGEISFRNIRVGNAASGPSLGSISIRDIDLRGTTITVRPL